jgi:hypothetical protein
MNNAHAWDHELRESQRRTAEDLGAGGGANPEDMAHIWGATLGDLLKRLGIPATEPDTNQWESPDGVVFRLQDISGRMANEPPVSFRSDAGGREMVTFWLVIEYGGRIMHVDRPMWTDPTSDGIRAQIANTIDELKTGPRPGSKIYVEATVTEGPYGEEFTVPIMPGTPAHRLLRAFDSYTRDLLGDIIAEALDGGSDD